MKVLIYSGLPYISTCSIEEHYSTLTDFLLNVAIFNEVRFVECYGREYKKLTLPYGINCYVVGSPDDLKKEVHKQIKEWKPDVVHSSYYDLFLIELKEEYPDIKTGFTCAEPGRPEGDIVLNSGKYDYLLNKFTDLFLLVDYVLFTQGDYMERSEHLKNSRNLHYIAHQYDPLYIPTEEELIEIEKNLLVSCYGALELELKKRVFKELFFKPSAHFPLKFSSNLSRDSLLDEYKDCVVISPFLPHSKLYSAYSKSFYGLQIFGWDSARFSYGAKPIEQAASGCAILIQKNPDVEDVVIHGKTGFVVENAQDVIEACELAINNPDEVREMGLRAKSFIEEKYGPKVLNEKLQKIWRE